MSLIIEKTRRFDSTTERSITRYTPILQPIAGFPCFIGELRFAFWEVWTDEPEDIHTAAIASAKRNVLDVLSQLTTYLK